MKTINRSILATTATVYSVNPKTDKVETATVTLNGKAEERDFIKSTPYAYKVENLVVESAGMYTLPIDVFMEHAEKGIKPTTRTRYVTATVKSLFADVLMVNPETHETFVHEVNATGCANEKQILKKANAESTGLIAVAVKETRNQENHFYMLESEFMSLATFTPSK